MILASHGIIGSQIIVAPVATAATGVGQTSFTANWNAYTGAVVYLLDVSTSPTFNTFIYENQEVNAPSTSYVVIGLEPNTTYYYRVRASTEALTDPDAQAFFARVTAAGGTLSATEQTAVNTLVVQMKFDGIWNSMKAIYPMVGASDVACKQNLKSSSFTGTFSSGWTFAGTGVTPNGTSAFFNTQFNNQGDWTSVSNGSMGFVSRTNQIGAICDMGSGGIADGANSSTIYSRFSGDNFFSGLNCVGVTPGSTNTNSIGFFVTSRLLSTEFTRHKRGSSTINTTVSDFGGTNPNTNIYLGAGNNSVSALNFSNKQFSFCFIGDGITQSQVDAYFSAVTTFNNALSR